MRIWAAVLGLGFALSSIDAGAMPYIHVTAPVPGQPVTNLQPTITVSYGTDGTPLQLATLQVRVNSKDLSDRFRASASGGGASYTLSEAEVLTAGALTIDVSISDGAGGQASTTQPYDVLPTYQALTPTTASSGNILTVTVLGLDPVGSNSVVFTSLRPPDTVEVALESVDRNARTATARVPETAASGQTFVKVNGRVSQESHPFSLRSLRSPYTPSP